MPYAYENIWDDLLKMHRTYHSLYAIFAIETIMILAAYTNKRHAEQTIYEL